MSAETIELAKNYTQKRFVDLIRNNIVNGYRNTCADPRNCYNNNNNNNISLLQTHGLYTYKKLLNIYKNRNNNNKRTKKISQSKIVLRNITLISAIAEWESEYKQ